MGSWRLGRVGIVAQATGLACLAVAFLTRHHGSVSGSYFGRTVRSSPDGLSTAWLIVGAILIALGLTAFVVDAFRREL